MKTKTLLLFLVLIYSGFSQENIELEDCLKAARENMPGIENINLISSKQKEHISNLKTNYLPNLDLAGQLTYQSSVTELDIQIPGMSFTPPESPKDQYKLYLDFKQSIYDGGTTNQLIEIEKIKSDIELLDIDRQLYQLDGKIISLYFTKHILSENQKLLDSTLNILSKQESILQSAFENGIIRKSDILKIRAEKLKIGQQKSELNSKISSTLQSLEILTGIEFSGNENFIIEKPELNINIDNARIENKVFETQKNLLLSSSNLEKTSRYPKFYGFSQAGIGKPGLNMLSDETETYYIIGLGFQWNIFDWKKTNRKQQINHLNYEMINNNQAQFNQSIQIEINKQILKADEILTLIEKDKELVKIQTEIVKESALRLNNGTISSTEYLSELQKKTEYSLKLSTHSIEHIFNLVLINYLKGINLQ